MAFTVYLLHWFLFKSQQHGFFSECMAKEELSKTQYIGRAGLLLESVIKRIFGLLGGDVAVV